MTDTVFQGTGRLGLRARIERSNPLRHCERSERARALESARQVGCIHTCQGLDLEYVGVIVGPDFVVRDGRAVVDASKRASADSSVRGYKQLLWSAPEEARRRADMIVKKTYRALMTRGSKGCFVHCVDRETNACFADRMGVARRIEM